MVFSTGGRPTTGIGELAQYAVSSDFRTGVNGEDISADDKSGQTPAIGKPPGHFQAATSDLTFDNRAEIRHCWTGMLSNIQECKSDIIEIDLRSVTKIDFFALGFIRTALDDLRREGKKIHLIVNSRKYAAFAREFNLHVPGVIADIRVSAANQA